MDPLVDVGANLEELSTEAFGFAGISGDKKLKLFPNPYPRDSLPPSSASLLAVAPKRGLLAAAGPDGLVIANTHAIHDLFLAGDNADEKNVIANFTPDATISTPRLRHVAFSSDEQYLVVSAEDDGGLLVYSAADLLTKNDPVHEVPTQGRPLRALAPNPSPASAHLFAAVLENGDLFIVDLAQATTKHLQGNVTSVCWSNMGKALITGLEDGSAAMHKTVAGAEKMLGVIPRPPDVDPNFVTSAVYWLANQEFLVIHSPKTAPEEDDMAADSVYHIATTAKDYGSLTLRRAGEQELLFPAMDIHRSSPRSFFVARLKDWEPDLVDMLIIASSDSIDVKVITHSKEKITVEQEGKDEYAVADFVENRRAGLPISIYDDAQGDTVPIGEALDLSGKVRVMRPIPMDTEYDKSAGPVPAYLVLNHEGLLSAWWVVHDESIRKQTTYPQLVNQEGKTSEMANTPTKEATPMTPKPAQNSNLFKQATSATPATPAFGTPSGFGAQAKPAFGAPSFGAPSFGAPAFGAPSAIGGGKPASPASFGSATTGFNVPSTSAFGKPSQPVASGQTSSSGTTNANPFSSYSGTSPFSQAPASGASPFSSQATGAASSPFANLNNKPSTAGSPFANLNKPASGPDAAKPSPFGGLGAGTGTSGFGGFGGNKADFSFGKPSKGTNVTNSFGSTTSIGTGATGSTLSFGSGIQARDRDETTPTPQAPSGLPNFGSNFKLGSTFKPDGSAKDDLPKPKASSGGLFGDLDSSLNISKPPETPIKKETEAQKAVPASTTPVSPPKAESPPADDAPLPPDFLTTKPPKVEEDLPPLAGSPPIKVEAEEADLHDIPSSPVEEQSEAEESVEEEEGEEEEEEGEGESEFSLEEEESDEGEEDEGEDDASEVGQPTPDVSQKKTGWQQVSSAAMSPQIRPAAPTPPVSSTAKPALFGNTPAAGQATASLFAPQPKTSGSIFDKPMTTTSSLFPKSAVAPTGSLFDRPATSTGSLFNPPAGTPDLPLPKPRAQETLRSPSPVRPASTSALSTRQQSKLRSETPLSASIRQPVQMPAPQPELSDLSDEDDERIRRELASEIEPSPTLAEFISHQNYTGSVTKTGTAATIERTYRDINSMIDTLALNARSLESFLQFHSTRQPVSRDDLDTVLDGGPQGPWFDDWHLAQVADLKDLEDQLETELDSGRVQDVLGKLSQLNAIHRERARLLTKLNDIRRQIINRRDPARVEANRKSPLPKDLADQQKALRNEYARLLSLMSQSEEAAMLLKSKLASKNAGRGKAGAVPTVDAVKRTIGRMIEMTEKKVGDIALLEAKLRKLQAVNGNASVNGNGSGNGYDTPGTPRRSIMGTGTGTPRSSRTLVIRSIETPERQTTPRPGSRRGRGRQSMTLGELSRVVQTPEPDEESPSGGYGLYYTPEGTPSDEGVDALRRLNEMSGEQMAEFVEAGRRRHEVAEGLAKVLRGRGVRVTRVARRKLEF